MSLVQLLQAYFTFYDQLDELEKGLRAAVSELLQRQAHVATKSARGAVKDLVSACLKESWLFHSSAPAAFVKECRQSGMPLVEYARRIRVESVFAGRFGAICRAIYYLDVLREIPVGEHHEVLDELMDPRVHSAPYEDELRVGHAALGIIIDRADAKPSEAWQNFVLKVAGDPRVGSRSKSFLEWWIPLTERRIQKVRGWLSREDIRLFLRAVEEYGKESGDQELQRMFPARQRFLEGLHDQGLVRNSHLMFGLRAEWHIKKILGQDMLSSYSTLKGMTDKAVIYMDCGDFHLIEGSHSFKIWVYLACPHPLLNEYARGFTHSDLTHRFPSSYESGHPGKPYNGFTHHPTSWRHNVIDFLARQGINLQWHRLFSDREWDEYKNSYGIPVVKKSSRR